MAINITNFVAPEDLPTRGNGSGRTANPVYVSTAAAIVAAYLAGDNPVRRLEVSEFRSEMGSPDLQANSIFQGLNSAVKRLQTEDHPHMRLSRADTNNEDAVLVSVTETAPRQRSSSASSESSETAEAEAEAESAEADTTEEEPAAPAPAPKTPKRRRKKATA